MSWVTASWLPVWVWVNRSKDMPKLFPRLQEQGVIAVDHLGGGDALLVGADGYGRAVGVAAGHHQHAVALQPVVAGEDVGGQVTAGDMAHVQRAVGVGPGNTDENAFGQDQSSSAVRRDRNPFGNSSTTGFGRV